MTATGVGNTLAATAGGDVVALGSVSISVSQRRPMLIRVEMFASLGAVGRRSKSTSGTNSSSEDAPKTSLQLVGTVDAVNVELADCIYVPPAQRSDEWDRVVFVMRYNVRLGGSGASRWDDETSAVLPVRINAVARPPTVYWVDSMLKRTSQLLAASSLQTSSPLPELAIKTDKKINGEAAATAGFHLVIRAEHGSFVWDNGSTARDGPRALELSGTTAELVKKFRRVRYRAPSMRFLLLSLPTSSSRVDQVTVTLLDRTERYRTRLNETIQLDIEREGGWWSAVGEPVRRFLVVKEDESASIARLLNQEAIHLVGGNLSLSVSASHGQIRRADKGDEAGTVVIEAANARDLIAQSSSIWYTPVPDFHGFDELHAKLETLDFTISVQVLPVNDAPVIGFLADDSSAGWYDEPIMVLPSIVLDDPDDGDLLSVRVRAVNASIGAGDLTRPAFDGVSATQANATVLELGSSLERLRDLLASRLIEVAPHMCSLDSNHLCAGLVEVCVSDGIAEEVCAEVSFPAQPQYFSIDCQQEVGTITAGELTGLAGLFNLTERDPSIVELTLVLTLSAGSLHYELSSCANWYGPTWKPPATDGGIRSGARYVVTAPDLRCMSSALSTSTFQTVKSDGGLARIGLKLLANGTRFMVSKEVLVSIAPFVEPALGINIARVADAPVQAGAGDQLELAAFFALSLEAITGDQEAGILADLTVACSACAWSYEYFVPRSSYEFAQLPSSNLMVTGPLAVMTAVLESLKFVVNPVPGSIDGAETVSLTLRRHSSTPASFNPVFVTVLVEEDPLRWRVLHDNTVIRAKDRHELADGIQIVGKESNSALSLRLRVKCIEGVAVLTFKSDSQPRALCGPNEDSVHMMTSRGQINQVLASIIVEDHPGRDSDTTTIELAVGEKTRASEDLETTTLNVRWGGPRPPSLRPGRDESLLLRANASDPVLLMDALTVASGAQNAWQSRLLTVRASVRHGTLFVPEKVCCVEIRSPSAASELVISGEATALTAALASTLYVGDADFAGEDLLTASVAVYGEPWTSDAPATRVRIAVDMKPTGRALASDQLQVMTFDEDTGQWSGDLEQTEFTTADAYLVPSFYSDPEEIEIEDEFDFDDSQLEPIEEPASQPSPVWPLLHIEGTLEGGGSAILGMPSVH